MSASHTTNGTAKPEGLAAEALLRAVVETSDEAMFTCDAQSRITWWSATAERLFGRPTGDVVERPLEDLFAEHLRPEVRSVVARALAGEHVKHFETEVQRPDGMPLPFSVSLCPVADTDDVVAAALVIARDVTEQRLAQATLGEVEARLTEGEALAHVGSWLWDVRTGAVQWSGEFHRIHGLDPSAFDGTLESHLGMVSDGDRARVRAAMEASVASGRSLDEQYEIVRGDDKLRLLRVRAHPTLGSDGRAIGLRGIGQDVTTTEAPSVTRYPPDA